MSENEEAKEAKEAKEEEHTYNAYIIKLVEKIDEYFTEDVEKSTNFKSKNDFCEKNVLLINSIIGLYERVTNNKCILQTIKDGEQTYIYLGTITNFEEHMVDVKEFRKYIENTFNTLDFDDDKCLNSAYNASLVEIYYKALIDLTTQAKDFSIINTNEKSEVTCDGKKVTCYLMNNAPVLYDSEIMSNEDIFEDSEVDITINKAKVDKNNGRYYYINDTIREKIKKFDNFRESIARCLNKNPLNIRFIYATRDGLGANRNIENNDTYKRDFKIRNIGDLIKYAAMPYEMNIDYDIMLFIDNFIVNASIPYVVLSNDDASSMYEKGCLINGLIAIGEAFDDYFKKLCYLNNYEILVKKNDFTIAEYQENINEIEEMINAQINIYCKNELLNPDAIKPAIIDVEEVYEFDSMNRFYRAIAEYCEIDILNCDNIQKIKEQLFNSEYNDEQKYKLNMITGSIFDNFLRYKMKSLDLENIAERYIYDNLSQKPDCETEQAMPNSDDPGLGVNA